MPVLFFSLKRVQPRLIACTVHRLIWESTQHLRIIQRVGIIQPVGIYTLPPIIMVQWKMGVSPIFP